MPGKADGTEAVIAAELAWAGAATAVARSSGAPAAAMPARSLWPLFLVKIIKFSLPYNLLSVTYSRWPLFLSCVPFYRVRTGCPLRPVGPDSGQSRGRQPATGLMFLRICMTVKEQVGQAIARSASIEVTYGE